MKIALLAYHLKGISGIARHILRQAREMTDMGHEVDVWAMEYDAEKCYPELVHGIDIHSVFPVNRVTQSNEESILGVRMLSYLNDMRRRYNMQKRMFEQMANDYDVINPHGHTVSWAAVMYKRQYDAPVIWLCNDFWVPGGSMISRQHSSGIKSKIKDGLTLPIRRYDHNIVNDIDRIVVLSHLVGDDIEKEYNIKPNIIPTGVDPITIDVAAGQEIRRRYGFHDDTFLLITIALLMERRRTEDVIRAVEKLRGEGINVGYLIVGRESYRPEYVKRLKDEVQTNQLGDYIKFAGEIPGEDLEPALNAGDAFVWSADATQSWGMACLEAMTARVPAIVSNSNGLSEALEHNVNALLYDGENIDSLVSQIKRMMDDADLREKVRLAGQQFAIEKYSWRGNAESMLTLFRESMNTQSPELITE
ncbi:MAG: glycosyltransferase family 4 protein [Aggregatilineales bacterium]